MKNKQLWLSLALLAVVFGYLSFIVPFQMVLQILVFVTVFAVPIRLVYSYLIPNQWVFTNHKRLFSIYFGLMIWSLSTVNGQKTVSLDVMGITLLLVIFIAFVLYYIAEMVEKRYQNRKLADELVPLGERLLIASGFCIEESGKQQGLLILSAGKLTFVYNRKNIEPKVIDIQAKHLSISNFLLTPAGICTSDANFRVMFPRYWIKKIAEQKG